MKTIILSTLITFSLIAPSMGHAGVSRVGVLQFSAEKLSQVINQVSKDLSEDVEQRIKSIQVIEEDGFYTTYKIQIDRKLDSCTELEYSHHFYKGQPIVTLEAEDYCK